MRLRTALIGLGCSLAILIAGCSAPTIAGAPQVPGAGSDSTAVVTGDDGTGDDGPGTGGSGGGNGIPGLSGLPTDLSDLTNIPGLGGLPTDLSDLTNIPGVSGQCLAVLNVFLAVSTLFLGPTLGGAALTQDQVDTAFKGVDQAPAELQPAIKVLHDAANQAVGKSAAAALAIVAADPVTDALNTLSDYTDSQCGQ